jgi:uncharacterized protein (DUF433 family)
LSFCHWDFSGRIFIRWEHTRWNRGRDASKWAEAGEAGGDSEVYRFGTLDYSDAMESGNLITIDAEILGGTPVIRGTRVPVQTLFDYLERDYTLSEFLECFPSVNREMACQILEHSESAMVAAAS